MLENHQDPQHMVRQPQKRETNTPELWMMPRLDLKICSTRPLTPGLTLGLRRFLTLGVSLFPKEASVMSYWPRFVSISTKQQQAGQLGPSTPGVWKTCKSIYPQIPRKPRKTQLHRETSS